MKKMWCDLKTDKDKAEFFKSGRGSATGVLIPAIELDVARVYAAAALVDKARSEVNIFPEGGNKNKNKNKK